MAVYVDDMKAKLGRMVMCHMIADTRDELLAMADRIGVARKWIQRRGTCNEHFDISLGARAKAVAAGAQEVTMQDLARKCLAKRPTMPLAGIGMPIPDAKARLGR